MADLGEIQLVTVEDLASDLVRAAVSYWRDKRRGGATPLYADFEPTEIPRLLPHLIVEEARREPWDFRYRIVGSTVREHSRDNWTGRWMSEVPGQSPDSTVFRVQRAALERGEVLLFRPPYVGPHQGFKICEAAVTPWLGGGQPDRIVVAVDFIPAL